MLDTFLISYFVTGSGAWATSIAGIEVLTKIAIYYAHERAWNLIKWGRTLSFGAKLRQSFDA